MGGTTYGLLPDWWQRNIGEPGKLPLLLLFLAFVVTFLLTRTITRLIRAGRGPFHDMASGDVHIHHSVPGIALLMLGGAVAVTAQADSVWNHVAAIAVGVGASLVLDEFELILRLQDVYWQEEGRASVQAVALVTACLSLELLGFSPLGIDDLQTVEATWRWTSLVLVTTAMLASVVCVAKGKYRLALVAIFVPPVAWLGALRLARPGSLWYRRYHSDHSARRERAIERAKRWDERVDPLFRRIGDAVAGRPSTEMPSEARPPPSPSVDR